MKQLSKFYLKRFVCAIVIMFFASVSWGADFSSTLDLAEKGDTIAIGTVAVMYLRGEGVNKDYSEARKWAEKGVSAGDTNAFYVLGYLYHYGCGIKADYKKAYDLYYKAAEQGHAAALNNIGVLWHRKGGAQNALEAAKWYTRAASCGSKVAEENLNSLDKWNLIRGDIQPAYNEEFDRTLAKNLAKQRNEKHIAKHAAIIDESNGGTSKDITSILDVVGFEVSSKVKSNEGYLIISKIKSGSVAEKMGMLIGSDLYQVDNMNTKQFTGQEIRNYLIKQREAGATVFVVFMAEDGSPKRIDIKLK